MFDVIVAGGGPAGLSAALVLGRCRRRIPICDEGRPRNAANRAVHNFFTREGMAPDELLRIGRAQLRPYEIDIRRIGARSAVNRKGDFDVRLADGRRVRARKLLLATGIRDHGPDIAGVKQFIGRGVYYCSYCDGYTVRDRPPSAVSCAVQGVAKELRRAAVLRHAGDCERCLSYAARASLGSTRRFRSRVGVTRSMKPTWPAAQQVPTSVTSWKQGRGERGRVDASGPPYVGIVRFSLGNSRQGGAVVSKEQALYQSLASCGAAVVAFIGVCHEAIGSTLFPWGPALLGGPIGWHGVGLLAIAGGLLVLAGTLRVIPFPVVPFALLAVFVGSGLVVLTAVVYGQFHMFALAAAICGAITAFCHHKAVAQQGAPSDGPLRGASPERRR
jgi:Pyridine nucleotide-disulphide oxidoreductase